MKKVYLTLMVAATFMVACGPSAQEDAEKKENVEQAQDDAEKAMEEAMPEAGSVEAESQADVSEATELAEDTTSILENSPVVSDEQVERDPKKEGETEADVKEEVKADNVERR